MSGAEIEGFGRRGKESKMAQAENSGLEGEVRDEGGEIGNRAVGEGGPEVEGLAGIDAITLEGVAGGDNNGVNHEGAGMGQTNSGGGWIFCFGDFSKWIFHLGSCFCLAPLPISLFHCCFDPEKVFICEGYYGSIGRFQIG